MLVAEKGRTLPFWERHARYVESIVASGRPRMQWENEREKAARLRFEPTYKKVWLSATELQRLTAGSSQFLDLHAHTIQKTAQQYVRSREQHRRPWLAGIPGWRHR